ncbi:MAG: DNA (cytosine-5-)-methyltransferase [Desulfobacteraceae bacterium]|jgi:DNA (cytosine-5)-methyltransferase 1|nr:DNA (cytosine-5-)-methyltransferase [Desulfobacteraceae bacterium]
MPKKKINYKDLLDHLIQNTDELTKKQKIPLEEFPAVASHYLQSDGLHSIYGGEKAIKEYEYQINSFSGIEETIQDFVPLRQQLHFNFNEVPFPPPKNPKFTFVDMFAGIGGFRIAFQELGGKCLFSCEWDKFAKQTYLANFGETPFGDVRQFTDPEKVSDKELEKMIPDHDILTAGFPCQPFSIAGVSKKQSLGRKHGFDDPTQGTLFFDIKRILDVKRPKAFFLENVKNLLSHDKKRTFEIIMKSLEEDLGYIVNHDVVDGGNWVPQHRERVYIVGYNPEKIEITKEEINISLKPKGGYKYPLLRDIIKNKVEEKYTLGPGTWATLERHKKHHEEVGNGFGYGLINRPIKKDTVTRTMSQRYHKDGAEILIEQKSKPRPRRLTPTEALQLMGFDPDKFFFPVSDTQAYRQIGNSVVVPAVKATAKEISGVLKSRSK